MVVATPAGFEPATFSLEVPFQILGLVPFGPHIRPQMFLNRPGASAA